MKKLLAIYFSLFALNAMSATPRVAQNMHLLGLDMQAKVKSGEMNLVDIMVVPGLAPRLTKKTQNTPQLETSQRPLVIESSCVADLVYESSDYQYDQVCVDGDSCDCNRTETVEYKTANVAVDVYFDTDYAYEIADLILELVAIDPYTGEVINIDTEFYSQESSVFGRGDNTVVFNIDHYYVDNYNLEARVSISDEEGRACSVRTNSL